MVFIKGIYVTVIIKRFPLNLLRFHGTFFNFKFTSLIFKHYVKVYFNFVFVFFRSMIHNKNKKVTQNDLT
jgi:hypothetical protein